MASIPIAINNDYIPLLMQAAQKVYDRVKADYDEIISQRHPTELAECNAADVYVDEELVPILIMMFDKAGYDCFETDTNADCDGFDWMTAICIQPKER
jgi:hypothetical protein